jgi:hypothetical protein
LLGKCEVSTRRANALRVGSRPAVLDAELMLGTEFLLVEKPFDQTVLLENMRKVLDHAG